MQFSLIFFSGDERNKYRLVMEAAKHADEHHYEAIWAPERHYHRFGGLYASPAVLGAALAMTTRRLRIRAGSVLMPLYSPIRVAEEWAMVDNLSGGRAGLALATGFNPIDFAPCPERWADRRRITFEAVETLRSLWRGEPLTVTDGLGNAAEVELHPTPVQPELPLWLTCTKSVETFEKAGELGCHALTALIDMNPDELEKKLAAYHRTLAENGHDPAEHRVTLMLHTFVGDSMAAVRDTLREPFTRYLRSFMTVIDTQQRSMAAGQGVWDLARDDQEALLAFGFDKYVQRGALFGSLDDCSRVVERAARVGVTEIACLVDFGVDDALVLDSLARVDRLRERFA